MFLEWSILTVTTILSIFLYIKVLFYKNLTEKEERTSRMMKMTLTEAETLIRKYQVQLQRSLGNVDVVSSELLALKGDLKSVKQSHSKLKFEKKKLEGELKALQDKIEALS
jgi:peptidoglycan hydrolase CwlO-like protein